MEGKCTPGLTSERPGFKFQVKMTGAPRKLILRRETDKKRGGTILFERWY